METKTDTTVKFYCKILIFKKFWFVSILSFLQIIVLTIFSKNISAQAKLGKI